ncbi:MAG: hypothetical protein SVV88_10915, partial [Pseudomonadota bacterium]|nr:hypothetical protein [Pseudomonadota bacterium]
MSLTTFVSSTLTDAIEINDNFKHVGQGNLLPMGGSGLDNTTSVYDLGSSTYKWNNLFVNNIYADDIT